MGQFNSGYRRPDFSGSQNFSVPSNSSLAPVPASQPKSKTKLLIVVIAAAVILISIFAVINMTRAQKQKISVDEQNLYDAVEVLNYQFQDFYGYYDENIGLKLEKFHESTYSPIRYIYLNELEEKFSEINSSWEVIREFKNDNKTLMEDIEVLRSNVGPIVENTKQNIETLRQNDIIYDFSNLEIKGESCQMNNEQFDKMKSESNEEKKRLLENYAKELCELHKISESNNLNNQLNEAIEILNKFEITRSAVESDIVNSMNEINFDEDKVAEYIETILEEIDENYN